MIVRYIVVFSSNAIAEE